MFSHVITNKEQGYDQHTGVFTAPVDGVYAFFLHLVHDHGTHDVVLATIYKADGGQELCWTSAHALQAPNAYDEGSCAATTRLTKGQRVYVKRKAGGNGYSVTFAWFSGFLIGPDV
nr:hypothetical protein BaRGS_022653 [Batillaria attramentaria]